MRQVHEQRGHSSMGAIGRPLKAGDRTMTIEFAAVSIGIFLIVWVALIWKKLRVVDGRLALMQNELALMQNGIKELHIMESRLFNMFMLNAAKGHLEVADRHRRAALDEHIAELYAQPAASAPSPPAG
jgi:hypothetical protein